MADQADESTTTALDEREPADDPALRALERLIRERAILTCDQHVLLSSRGDEFRWLVDLKQIFLLPEALSTIAERFWERFGPMLPFQVGGLETASIPLITAILLEGARRGTTINGFIVRKERKPSGVGKRIEGQVTGERIVIVDDILNSGGSVETVRSVLEPYERRIDGVFVVIDYRARSGIQWRLRHRVLVDSLFRLEQFGLELKDRRPAPRYRFATVWRHDTPGGNFSQVIPKSSPALDATRVYFGTDSGIFWALDQATGAPVWQARVEDARRRSIWSSPAVHDGRVYYGGYDGNVYARDAATGREIWRYVGADWVGASPALAPERDLLFIGLEHGSPMRAGSVAALRLSTGALVWEHPVPEYVHSSPAYCAAHGLVAIGTNGGALLLLGANSGKLMWRHQTGGAIKHAPAFQLAPDRVVSAGFDGMIGIHDGRTGALLWSVPTGGPIYSSPLVVDGRAFVTSSDKHLHVLDLTERRVVERIALGAKSVSSPRLIDGNLFVGCNRGVVREIDPSTLEVVGAYQLPDSMTGAVAHNPATGRFFAATNMNSLYCFERAPSDDDAR